MPPIGGTSHFVCGEGGIRTRDTLSSIHTFQACSFHHSDTSPVPFFRGCKSTISPPSFRIFFARFRWSPALPLPPPPPSLPPASRQYIANRQTHSVCRER